LFRSFLGPIQNGKINTGTVYERDNTTGDVAPVTPPAGQPLFVWQRAATGEVVAVGISSGIPGSIGIPAILGKPAPVGSPPSAPGIPSAPTITPGGAFTALVAAAILLGLTQADAIIDAITKLGPNVGPRPEPKPEK